MGDFGFLLELGTYLLQIVKLYLLFVKILKKRKRKP